MLLFQVCNIITICFKLDEFVSWVGKWIVLASTEDEATWMVHNYLQKLNRGYIQDKKVFTK